MIAIAAHVALAICICSVSATLNAAHISEISPVPRTVASKDAPEITDEYPAYIEITLGDTTADTLQLVIADARIGPRSGSVLQVVTFNTAAAQLNAANVTLLIDSSGPATPVVTDPNTAAFFDIATTVPDGLALTNTLPRTLLLFAGNTGWTPTSASNIQNTPLGSATLLDALTFGPEDNTNPFNSLANDDSSEFTDILIHAESGDVIAVPHPTTTAIPLDDLPSHLVGPTDLYNRLHDRSTDIFLNLNPGQANLTAELTALPAPPPPHMPEPHTLAILLVIGAFFTIHRHSLNAK